MKLSVEGLIKSQDFHIILHDISCIITLECLTVISEETFIQSKKDYFKGFSSLIFVNFGFFL